MVGVIGNMCNRIGGFSITQKIDNTLKVKVPAGSKVLCLNCTLGNEETLIAARSVIKTSLGFDVVTGLDLTITKEATSPITILRGRELFYCEGEAVDASNTKFILPKGARVNKTVVPVSGEFTIATNGKYLIEY